MAPPSDPLTPSILSTDRFESDDAEATGPARMTFLEHLDELRRRILYALYAVIASCIVPFIYADNLYRWMLGYLQQVLPNGVKMIYTEATDGFMLELKLVVLIGLMIALPFVFGQLWLFVAPGLYAREKKVVIPFIISSTLLFAAGAAFSHYVAFLTMWKFFASFSNDYVQFMPTIKEAFSFYVKMALGLGAVFELPVLVFFLARFGIVTWQFLAKQWKYAVLGIFVLAAIITPSPDWATQCIFAAPMLVLYAISIGVAWLFGKKKKPARID